MADKERHSERQDSRSPGNHFSPKRERERSISRSRSRSRSRSYSPYRRTSSKRSKSPDRRRRSYSRSRSRSHSRSPDRRRRRSYSPYNGRHHSYSRSPSPYRRRRSPCHRKYPRSRSPMSDRRRHEGNRFSPVVNRCIGVFGLSLNTGEKEIREILEEYGRVEEIQVVYDRQTSRSRGFAFAYYEDLNDAIEAKERCNGMELDGRRIRVDYSITKRAHTPTPGVYMGRPTRSDRDRGDRDRDRGDRDRGDRDRYDDDRGYSRYGGGGGGGRYY